MAQMLLVALVIIFSYGCVSENKNNVSQPLNQSLTASDLAAKETTDAFHSALIAASKAASTESLQARHASLLLIMKKNFEFNTISMMALGDYWSGLSLPQKLRFTDTFERLAAATYASIFFKDWKGGSFSYLGVSLSGNKEVIRYQFSENTGAPIKFEYNLDRFSDGWKITNVIVDGVSDLRLKNAQYKSVIDKDGFDGIISKMEGQIISMGVSGTPILPSSGSNIKTDSVKRSGKTVEDGSLNRAKSDCAELFKIGSKDYGKCVMELLD